MIADSYFIAPIIVIRLNMYALYYAGFWNQFPWRWWLPGYRAKSDAPNFFFSPGPPLFADFLLIRSLITIIIIVLGLATPSCCAISLASGLLVVDQKPAAAPRL